MKLNEALLKRTGVALRSTHPLQKGSALLLGIPGGPGLSSRYLEASVISHSNVLGLTGALIDLPNNGSSRTPRSILGPFEYNEARQFLKRMLQELASLEIDVLLYGHSLGARIGLELLRDFPNLISRVILVSLPRTFKPGAQFNEYLKANGAFNPRFFSESDFQVWWRKILPAYFYKPLTVSTVEMLSAKTEWVNNERFSVGMPDFFEVARDVRNLGLVERIAYFEGEKEWILPDANFETIKVELPGLNAKRILGTGHFPMLETSGLLV